MASLQGYPSRAARRRRGWWTWNVGRIAGIPIRVHLTLLILLAWIAGGYLLSGAQLAMAATGVLLVVAIFGVILVHELGHALVARRYGIATRDILLLPIGGIASVERMPENPRHELAIALIGPAINLALAGALWAAIAASGGSTRVAAMETPSGSIVAQLMWINLGLALFNLLPAFPMDGGRALRAVLSLWMNHERATDVASALGRGCAVVIGVIGLFANPFLLVIAIVVWMGATQERALVHARRALSGVPVSEAMARRVETVSPGQPLEDAAALLVSGGLSELPVVDRGTPVGAITRGDVATALAQAGPGATVADAVQRGVVTIAPDDTLDEVFDRLCLDPEAVAVVVDDGQPVGVLTADHLATYVALHQAPPA